MSFRMTAYIQVSPAIILKNGMYSGLAYWEMNERLLFYYDEPDKAQSEEAFNHREALEKWIDLHFFKIRAEADSWWCDAAVRYLLLLLNDPQQYCRGSTDLHCVGSRYEEYERSWVNHIMRARDKCGVTPLIYPNKDRP